MQWHPTAYQSLILNQYDQVVQVYEQLVETEPDTIHHYWYLGLAYLLSAQEEAAQTTWLFALADLGNAEVEPHTLALTDILDAEAVRQVQLEELQTSWLIRQHIRQINPGLCTNLLQLLNVTILLDEFEPHFLTEWQAIDSLQDCPKGDIDSNLVLSTLAAVSQFPCSEFIDFLNASLHHADEPKKWQKVLLKKALETGEKYEAPSFGSDFMEILLQFDPDDINTLKYLCRFSINAKRYQRAREIAKHLYELSDTLPLQYTSNSMLLKALSYSGAWTEIEPIAHRHKILLNEIFQASDSVLDWEFKHSLVSSIGFFAYWQDNLAENRFFHNQASHVFRRKLRPLESREDRRDRALKSGKKLKIGYIAHTLRRHSVGWLSRWLFQHHNRDQFHITIYFVHHPLEDSFYREWFQKQADQTYSFGLEPDPIAEQIQADEIDILVDLDSISINVTYAVMALKPAPVQVTWLGWDAPGLSTVDHFIADPYVLAPEAQEHYQENIWRLPQTYIAVDGFEVGIPNLRRSDLDIPDDAVVYLSAQAGAKRHPLTVASQLKIVKDVPNSILLIKALGDSEVIKDYFYRMAEQEGVSKTQLRFFPWVEEEYTHRANLAIADIVLDTYPYNGATTTLEALWMGLPLVTRVGETFSARNSYAFLRNLGITEGIAWNEQDYVEWGIKLGQYPELRQQVAWKIHQARHTSPLWNAKQFTRDLEAAYLQMWERYCQQAQAQQHQVASV